MDPPSSNVPSQSFSERFEMLSQEDLNHLAGIGQVASLSGMDRGTFQQSDSASSVVAQNVYPAFPCSYGSSSSASSNQIHDDFSNQFADPAQTSQTSNSSEECTSVNNGFDVHTRHNAETSQHLHVQQENGMSTATQDAALAGYAQTGNARNDFQSLLGNSTAEPCHDTPVESRLKTIEERIANIEQSIHGVCRALELWLPPIQADLASQLNLVNTTQRELERIALTVKDERKFTIGLCTKLDEMMQKRLLDVHQSTRNDLHDTNVWIKKLQQETIQCMEKYQREGNRQIAEWIKKHHEESNEQIHRLMNKYHVDASQELSNKIGALKGEFESKLKTVIDLVPKARRGHALKVIFGTLGSGSGDEANNSNKNTSPNAKKRKVKREDDDEEEVIEVEPPRSAPATTSVVAPQQSARISVHRCVQVQQSYPQSQAQPHHDDKQLQQLISSFPVTSWDRNVPATGGMIDQRVVGQHGAGTIESNLA